MSQFGDNIHSLKFYLPKFLTFSRGQEFFAYNFQEKYMLGFQYLSAVTVLGKFSLITDALTMFLKA